MSVRQMLSTGYVYMPDFRNRIRGHNCRSCDTGVIKFKDVITLIDLMDDSDSMVRYNARWAFTFLINRHLVDQFDQHSTAEQASFAINAIQYLYTNHPDKYLLSRIYHILHTTSEHKSTEITMQAAFDDARAIFDTFCKDVWGERLTILPQKTFKGDLIIASHDKQQFITTTPSWALHERTIIEHTQGPGHQPDPNIIPIACFDSKNDVYQLLDDKLSLEAAAAYNDIDLLNDLIDHYPGLLKYMAFIKERRLNHNNYIYGDHKVSFLSSAYDDITKDDDLYKHDSAAVTPHDCGVPTFPDAETLLKRLPDIIGNNSRSFIEKHPHASQGATISYHNNDLELILSVNISERAADAYPFYMYTDWQLTKDHFERIVNTRYELENKGILYKNTAELERSEIPLLNYNSALYGYFTYLYDQSNNKQYINIHHNHVALGINGYMIDIKTYNKEPVAKKDMASLSNSILGFLLDGIDGR